MLVRSTIEAAFNDTAQEQQRKLVPLTDNLRLLDSGLDSLSLAVIVAHLESKLGVDPFSRADDMEIPATFGEFVALYQNAVA